MPAQRKHTLSTFSFRWKKFGFFSSFFIAKVNLTQLKRISTWRTHYVQLTLHCFMSCQFLLFLHSTIARHSFIVEQTACGFCRTHIYIVLTNFHMYSYICVCTYVYECVFVVTTYCVTVWQCDCICSMLQGSTLHVF